MGGGIPGEAGMSSGIAIIAITAIVRGLAGNEEGWRARERERSLSVGGRGEEKGYVFQMGEAVGLS